MPRFERERLTSDAVNARLLVVLQEGLPLVRRPFAAIGEPLGLSEEAVLARVRELFATGVARRFGAVFDSHSLGYTSTLCAADIPSPELEKVAARIAPHPGITHCYERAGHPNVWFTLTAPAAELKPEVSRVASLLGGYTVLDLPALKKFKIEAVFGRGDGTSKRAVPGKSPDDVRSPAGRDGARASQPTDECSRSERVGAFPERERRVVRCLQGNIAVREDPFGGVAEEVGYDPAELLELLGRWTATGVIRRVGLIVRHGRLGFSANSMCVWPVAPDRIAEAGCAMAASPHVSHCYERPASTTFPYNLYAMIHAKTREEAVGIFKTLAADAGLSKGRMLWSVREFKKTSPIFFCEPPKSPAEE